MASINGNKGGGVIDLGIVNAESQTKDSGLFQSPLPGANSNNAILLDVFGCFRTIVINGTYAGNLTQQRAFITAIESIVSGRQVSSTFVSSLTTDSKKVFVQSFNWEVQEANTGKINYTLTLLEGKEIT